MDDKLLDKRRGGGLLNNYLFPSCYFELMGINLSNHKISVGRSRRTAFVVYYGGQIWSPEGCLG
jgi:hypothetical protein